jgi:hypothetical protein
MNQVISSYVLTMTSTIGFSMKEVLGMILSKHLREFELYNLMDHIQVLSQELGLS